MKEGAVMTEPSILRVSDLVESHKEQTTRRPHEDDIEAGRRMRVLRNMRKMTQTELGRRMGVTFQQCQKYESGANRLSASRLKQVAGIFGVSVGYFFGEGETPERMNEMEELIKAVGSSDGHVLNKSFSKIQDKRVRRQIVNLVRALANECEEMEDAA